MTEPPDLEFPRIWNVGNDCVCSDQFEWRWTLLIPSHLRWEYWIAGYWISFYFIRHTFLLLILFLIPGIVMMVAYGLISLELYQGIKFDASQKKSARGNCLLAVCLCQKITQLGFCNLTRHPHGLMEIFTSAIRLWHEAQSRDRAPLAPHLSNREIIPLPRAPS